MRKPTLLFAATMLATVVLAATVELTPEEQQACDTGGGCVFATVSEINKRIRAAFDLGVKHGTAKCGLPA
jgi:hypothetical protein